MMIRILCLLLLCGSAMLVPATESVAAGSRNGNVVSPPATNQTNSTGIIRGTVKSPQGKPLYGILVKARQTGTNMITTVVTDDSGHYEFPPRKTGKYSVWVGTAWRHTVSLTGQGATQDFTIELGLGLINQTTGSSWFAAIPGSKKDKYLLTRKCFECHSSRRLVEFGPASVKGWHQIINIMSSIDVMGTKITGKTGYNKKTTSYFLNLTDKERKEFPKLLAALITPETKEKYIDKAIVRPRGLAAKAVFTEWYINEPLSNVWTDPDGVMWYGRLNGIGRLDPKTGKVETWDYKVPKIPFAIFHDVFGDNHHNLWWTASGANQIVKFNTKAHKFTHWSIPRKFGGWVHTARLDHKGNLWATLENEVHTIGAVVKINLKTKHVYYFPVPTRNPDNYGLCIDKQGNIWFTERYGGKLGEINPDTAKMTEYPTPTPDAGPRRIQADSTGRLWFTEYFAGKLGLMIPTTGKITEYDIGQVDPSPYMVKIDKHDGIWITLQNGSMLEKFDPKTGQFVGFLQPNPEVFGRDASFYYADGRTYVDYGSGGISFNPGRYGNGMGVITRMYIRN